MQEKAEEKKTPGADNSDLSSIAENQDEIYSEDESIYGMVNGKRQKGISTSVPNLINEDMYLDDQNSGSMQNLQQDRNKSPLRTNHKPSSVSNGRLPSRYVLALDL